MLMEADVKASSMPQRVEILMSIADCIKCNSFYNSQLSKEGRQVRPEWPIDRGGGQGNEEEWAKMQSDKSHCSKGFRPFTQLSIAQSGILNNVGPGGRAFQLEPARGISFLI